MAGFYWVERVMNDDLMVEIKGLMIRSDQTVLRGYQETQLTRIANLAIRELLTLTPYK